MKAFGMWFWIFVMIAILGFGLLLFGCLLLPAGSMAGFRAGAEAQPTVGINIHAGAVDTPYGSGEDLDVDVDVTAPIDLEVEAQGEE